MKRIPELTVMVAICVIMLSCSRQRADLSEYNEDVYSPKYASGFSIKKAAGKESVLITSLNPWQGADSINTSLLILRNNEEAPDNFDGQIINGNASRIVTMSSTHIAMLDAIGEVSRVKGVSGIHFITNPYINENKESIGDIGFEGNINYELLAALEPDIVMLYGVNGASSMENKLKELKIPYLYVGDYLEESPLGKTEWVIPVAELTGNKDLAISYLDSIAGNYEHLRDKLKENMEIHQSSMPKVMINTPYNGAWFIPSTGSYMVTLIKDAGGKLIYDKNTGNSSVPVDMEESFKLVSDADMWINPGTISTYNELKTQLPKYSNAKCVTDRKVYNNNLRSTPGGGNDFYESGIMHPDMILSDLIKIFHPETCDTIRMTYYQNLK